MCVYIHRDTYIYIYTHYIFHLFAICVDILLTFPHTHVYITYAAERSRPCLHTPLSGVSQRRFGDEPYRLVREAADGALEALSGNEFYHEE